jgi:hypothetical protein
MPDGRALSGLQLQPPHSLLAGEVGRLEASAAQAALQLQAVQRDQQEAARQLQSLQADVGAMNSAVQLLKAANATASACLAPSNAGVLSSGRDAADTTAAVSPHAPQQPERSGPATCNLAAASRGAQVISHSPLAAGQAWGVQLRAALHAMRGAAVGRKPFTHPLADALLLSPRLHMLGRCLRLRHVGGVINGSASASTGAAFIEAQLPALARVSSVGLGGRPAGVAAPAAALPRSWRVELLNRSAGAAATTTSEAADSAGVPALVGVMAAETPGSGAVLSLSPPVTVDMVRLTVTGTWAPEAAAGEQQDMTVCVPHISVQAEPVADGAMLCG